jgi:hypothetical protein
MGLGKNYLTDTGLWVSDATGDAMPASDLVNTTTDLLHQIGDGVGFVACRGDAAELVVHRSRARQVALLEAVWAEMVRRRWNPCAPDEVRLNTFEANDGRLPREIVGDVFTFKRLHFDPHSILFSHLYEAPQNLEGGDIALVDVRGYLHDNGLDLSEVFEPLHLPGHNGRLIVRDEHRLSMLASYATHVAPPAPGELLLLMVRNDPSVGVAHQIADIRPIDATVPCVRRFFRASIAPHH